MIWTETTNGKRMPVDADPVLAPRGFRLEGFGGRGVDELDESETPIARFTAEPAPDERLYQSHHGTCPDGGFWRRK